MDRRGIIAALASLPFVGVAAAYAKAWQTMLDAEAFFSFAPKAEQSRNRLRLYRVAGEIAGAIRPMYLDGGIGVAASDGNKYWVEVWEDTGNIVVRGEQLGFAITKRTIEDGNYIEQAKATFGKLLLMTTNIEG